MADIARSLEGGEARSFAYVMAAVMTKMKVDTLHITSDEFVTVDFAKVLVQDAVDGGLIFTLIKNEPKQI